MKSILVRRGMRLLAVGAHPDDVELSCGGFLLSLQRNFDVQITLIICSDGELKTNRGTRTREQKEANKFLRVKNFYALGKQDGKLMFDSDLVNMIEKIIDAQKPELVLTHYLNDIHQDHRNVCQATVAAARKSPATLIFYPSLFTREPFVANLYTDISGQLQNKLKLLSKFKSQQNSIYLQPKTVEIRALEAGLYRNCQYAEKFYIYFAAA